jgi:hypothetical protein
MLILFKMCFKHFLDLLSMYIWFKYLIFLIYFPLELLKIVTMSVEFKQNDQVQIIDSGNWHDPIIFFQQSPNQNIHFHEHWCTFHITYISSYQIYGFTIFVRINEHATQSTFRNVLDDCHQIFMQYGNTARFSFYTESKQFCVMYFSFKNLFMVH